MTIDKEARRDARRRLSAAVRAAHDAGTPPKCANAPERWFAADLRDRQLAALDCHGCPLSIPCADAGQHENWGVWGGQNRERPTKEERKNV